MLAYFPQIYAGELLYSVLARYHRHVCSNSPKQTAEDLFGRREIRASVDLQAGLGALCERIPQVRGLTPERLAWECTLYPYYTAFQPKAVAKAVLSAMIRDGMGGVHMRLGIVNGDTTPPTHLHFCQACRSEMLKAHGELYWQRDHQLPGVLICPRHRIPLADSTVRLDLTNRLEFVAADTDNCDANADREPWAADSPGTALLHRIALRSAALLTTPPTAEGSERLAEEYRLAVHRRGFGAHEGIDRRKLAAAYAQALNPIMELVPAADPGASSNNWLTRITQRRRLHPLKHLLFRLFLEELPLHSAEEQQPFGPGPWPCRNPLAKHYGQAVTIQFQMRRVLGRTIGRFTCSCGLVYSLAEGFESKPRILVRGPLFDDRLRSLVAEGSGLHAAARTLAVSRNAVRFHAARLGLAVPWKPRQRRSNPAPDRDIILSRRLAAKAERPRRSQTEHAELLKVEHRSPRDGRELLGKRRVPLPESARVANWNTVDSLLAQALIEQANALKAEEPPRRITLSELERRLCKPRWIRARIRQGKLPQTAAAFNEAVGTADEFYLRRLTWAAGELERQGLPMQSWRIRRLAGLRGKKSSPAVEAALAAIDKGGSAAMSRSSAAKAGHPDAF